ncbi:hypothetical protein [Paractinoplanes rishiriensis]|uniref:Uncharacterized protein n=1 Tax=Paractinoplanes rishiriensis TaxID=1050105 RepID=A0A919JYL1_9ACTN|nr:hypothetical protein [Actinoplanes rishiriensis]GIE95912.1 hypothetical protein Ari01nite_33770 [Actinoplanes rishiriensis]
MEKPDRRPISLTGLGLISAGAVLGLALSTPAAAAPTDTPQPKPAPMAEKDDRP